MTGVNKKIAEWVCGVSWLPYRTRKSVVKRLYPELLKDYPFEVDFFNLRFEGNVSDYISRMVFFCGAYEKYMLGFFKDYTSSLKKESLVFFDIGANVGNHALFMSQHAGSVHAFEPYSLVREQMEKNVRLNNLDNVHIHPVGLGNTNESVPFYAPPDSNLGAGSFTEGHYEGNSYVADLEVVVGDEEVKRLGLESVDVMKVDVEGYERFVLDGLKDTLEKFRPLVVLELSDTTRKTFSDFNDFRSVFPDGYVFLRFSTANRDNGNYKVSYFDYGDEYKRKDVIACPKDKLDYICQSGSC